MKNLESIFNSMDEGLIMLGPTGDVLYFNSEANYQFKKLGAVLGEAENIFANLPSGIAIQLKSTVDEVLQTKSTVRLFLSHTALTLSDSNFFAEVQCVPALDDDIVTHINVLIRDVSVNKIFEKKIVGMANELQALIDQASAVILITDSRGYITDWNQHTAALTKYSRNEAFAQKFTSLAMAQEDIHIFNQMIDSVLNGWPVLNVEVPIIDKMGKKLTFLLSASSKNNTSGQPIGVVFVGQDITERRRIESEYKFTFDRYLFHLENTPLGFIEWDKSFTLKSCTKRTEEIFGWHEKREEQIGRSGYELFYPEDEGQARTYIGKLLSGEDGRNQFQVRNVTYDGKIIWCEWFNSVLRDSQGNVITIMTLIQDTTIRKQYELKLQQAIEELEAYKKTLEQKVDERTKDLMQALRKEKDVVEMKSRFVSIASHEFKTPLSSIQHASSVIRGQLPKSSEPLIEKLNDIDKQTKHMLYLLEDVLTYGKSEAGKIQMITSQVDCQSFLKKLIEDVEHATKNTHVIKLKQENPIHELNTDEKLLRNVLINLLTNAIKYSPGKKNVVLDVEQLADRIQFKVIDKGMGIPPDEKSKVFEPFVRGKITENIAGTGLGLSIVKKAVELLKGTIDVESEVGAGSTFVVTIPI